MPSLSLWPFIFKVFITGWLVLVSIIDRRRRRVPNVLTLPFMFGFFLWQLYFSITNRSNTILFVVAAWAVLFGLWRLCILGGGDTKLLMALLAIFPTTQFLILLSLVKLIVSVPLLIAKYVRGGGLQALQNARDRLAGGQFFPRQEELMSEGRPHCWSYALPGVIYLWWLV